MDVAVKFWSKMKKYFFFFIFFCHFSFMYKVLLLSWSWTPNVLVWSQSQHPLVLKMSLLSVAVVSTTTQTSSKGLCVCITLRECRVTRRVRWDTFDENHSEVDDISRTCEWDVVPGICFVPFYTQQKTAASSSSAARGCTFYTYGDSKEVFLNTLVCREIMSSVPRKIIHFSNSSQ